MLFLDADEESTKEFESSVRGAIYDGEAFEAFYAAPAFIYNGKWLKNISGYPNWHPRLVKRSGSVRFTGGVWEEFSEPALAGKISQPYLHYTNAKGLGDWISKHVRYAKWESARISSTAKPADAPKERRQQLRNIRYRLGSFRKYFAIAYLFLIRRGFLDGPEGISYLRRMFIYELLIDEYTRENARITSRGGL